MKDQLSALLQTEASKLEKKRKKLRFFHYLHLFLAEIPASILIVCVVISALIGTIIPLPFALYAIGGAIVVVALKMIPIPYVKYHDHIKEKVLPKIFNEINSTFEFHPEGLDMDALKQSGIFASRLFSKAKYIEGEDLVTGVINEVKVSFNEVKFYSYPINWLKTIGRILLIIILLPLIIYLAIVTSEGDVGSDDGGSTFFVRDEINFYKGLFLHAEFNKDFNGKVVFIPKSLTGFRDKFSQYTANSDLSPIRIENALLDEKYTVHASNEQLAYYLLSPAFIESIFEIYSSEKVLPLVTFRDGEMFMTIPWDKDYFNVRLKDKVTGPEYFTKYINEIESFQKIVEHMNLDRRIWSKV